LVTEFINGGTLSDGADNNHISAGGISSVGQWRFMPRDTIDVSLQVVRSSNDSGVIVRINQERSERWTVGDLETIWAGLVFNVPWLTEREARGSSRQKEDESEGERS
jgi:hypothetical protein